MTTHRIPEDFTTLHGLASLYIGFAFVTDGDLSEEEIHTIVDKIAEWEPNASRAEIGGVCEAAYDWLTEIGELEQVNDVTLGLAELLVDEDSPFKDNVQAIVSDLVQISMADGQIHPNEEAFIRTFAEVVGATVPSKFRATI